jgi:PIF1-like helicase
LIVDEVSFSRKKDIQDIESNCRILKQNANWLFGNIDVIFAGDVTQLKPVQGKPIYMEKDFSLWDESIHTFLELNTNHRFKNDKNWGQLLCRYRDVGPTPEDIHKINKRVLNSRGGPTEKHIPTNATYATTSFGVPVLRKSST